MMSAEKRLQELGLELPSVPPAAGAYIPAVKTGNLVVCSGQGPYKDGSFPYIGRVGQDLTLEEGYQAARISVLNCLAEICTAIGSLNQIKKIVNVKGYVNSAPDFHDQPKVMNGASELLLEIFGETGKHTRCALGTSNLPGNIPVEVEMIVEV
ncbi:MAG: RidA family protein [bacterium]|nr:RidA family protein [bacterium]